MAQTERKTQDKRVIRTKKAIRNAFSELISGKDLNDITVKDLADKANINRKTFYNYYSGIYQVVEELERELVNGFEKALSDIDMKKCMTDPRVIFDRIDALILGDIEFYGNIFTAVENFNLITKMTALIKEKTKRAICSQLGLGEDKADIALEFVISGMISAYQMWFRSDRTRPLSDVSDIVGALSFHGLYGLLNS
ncbi:MAG: TetR/AcrR family transcriptional regulator [Clostridia bacterium]|nr:TetR/AcrR family transcriptional regulator [Clostridia bacterium]